MSILRWPILIGLVITAGSVPAQVDLLNGNRPLLWWPAAPRIKKPEVPCPKASPVQPLSTPSAGSDLAGVALEASGTVVDFVMSNALECLPASKGSNFVRQQVLPSVGRRLNGKPLPKGVTEDQLVKIDLYTRALMGEMASSVNCTDEEVMALGKIILNRTDVVEQCKGGWKAFSKVCGPNTWLSTLTHPHQFQALEEGLLAVSCPPTDIRQKLPDGTASGSYSYPNTYRATDIATRMVLDGENFRRQTGGVKGFLYTKSTETEAKWKKLYKKITGIYVGERVIDNPQCIHLWENLPVVAKSK